MSDDCHNCGQLVDDPSAQRTWDAVCPHCGKLVWLSPGQVVACKASRLARFGVVVGLGDGEYFVASDVPAILSHTRDMFFLADGDVAVLTRDGVHSDAVARVRADASARSGGRRRNGNRRAGRAIRTDRTAGLRARPRAGSPARS